MCTEIKTFSLVILLPFRADKNLTYLVAVGLVLVVGAIAAAVANRRGVAANVAVALKLACQTIELGAVLRFVRPVAAIVLRVASPPEQNAFIRVRTAEVRRRAVAVAVSPVFVQHKVLGAGALRAAARRQQTQRRAVQILARVLCH